MLPPGLRLDCDLGLGDMVGHVLLWFFLSLVTCGAALFLFPYSLARTVLERTYVLDERGQRVGRLDCPFDPGADIIHAVVWWLLTLVTLGVAGFFYAYRVHATVLNRTRIVAV